MTQDEIISAVLYLAGGMLALFLTIFPLAALGRIRFYCRRQLEELQEIRRLLGRREMIPEELPVRTAREDEGPSPQFTMPR